ncbi:hypothetical protein ABVK25_001612 [Lepraria finkii]|uniref:Uncharacterized protein n=1 Tax=Lepraria finkii TaxID=1340010 RepID=A0ABR4BJJ5_9LECA
MAFKVYDFSVSKVTPQRTGATHMRCSLPVQTISNCQQCFKEVSSGKSLDGTLSQRRQAQHDRMRAISCFKYQYLKIFSAPGRIVSDHVPGFLP